MNQAYYEDLDDELLSLDEERELGAILLENDPSSENFLSARNKLVEKNYRLVFKIAFSITKTKSIDAIQNGQMGLINAANHFDYTKGRFSTLAVPYIRNAIIDGFYEDDFINLPRHIRSDFNKISKATEKYNQKYGTMPSDSYLANELGYDTLYIRLIQILPSVVCNLEFDQKEPLDIVSDIKDIVNDNLSLLDEKEKDIVCRYYGIGFDKSYNFKELAEVYQMSSERIRQIHNTAIAKMKENNRAV